MPYVRHSTAIVKGCTSNLGTVDAMVQADSSTITIKPHHPMKLFTTYQSAFAEWQRIATDARLRSERIDRSIQDRGWALALTVGIPRDGCALHNASIDDGLTGWCHKNPTMLKVAKQANHLVNQWPAHRIADRLVKRAWNRLIAAPFGYCHYDLV